MQTKVIGLSNAATTRRPLLVGGGVRVVGRMSVPSRGSDT